MKRLSIDQKKKPPPLPSEKESTIWSTTARVERPRSPEPSPIRPSTYWSSVTAKTPRRRVANISGARSRK